MPSAPFALCAPSRAVGAGFGSDFGAEKYLNLVSRRPVMVPPDAVVVVATVRALRHHGGVLVRNLDNPNVEAAVEGMDNLRKHVENIKSFNRPVIVALNRFDGDSCGRHDGCRQRRRRYRPVLM